MSVINLGIKGARQSSNSTFRAGYHFTDGVKQFFIFKSFSLAEPYKEGWLTAFLSKISIGLDESRAVQKPPTVRIIAPTGRGGSGASGSISLNWSRSISAPTNAVIIV